MCTSQAPLSHVKLFLTPNPLWPSEHNQGGTCHKGMTPVPVQILRLHIPLCYHLAIIM
jgi:hypothetical protein